MSVCVSEHPDAPLPRSVGIMSHLLVFETDKDTKAKAIMGALMMDILEGFRELVVFC